MSLLVIWLILLILILFYGLFSYLVDRIRYRLPPGPMPMPFIGSMWLLVRQPRKQKLSITMRKIAEKYGRVFTFYFGPMRMIGIDDARTAYDTLVKQGKLFSWRFERRMAGFEDIGEGVLFANGETWRRHRRFSLKAMRDFGMGKAVMVNKIQHEADYLLVNCEENAKNGKPFNPRRMIANAVSNVISALVFGKRFEDANDAQFVDLLSRLDELASITTAESAAYLFFPFMKYVRTPVQVKVYEGLHSLITQIVTTAINEHRADFDDANIRDFPDLFIQGELTQQDVMDIGEFGYVMVDMFAAGTETTSTALMWTLLYLTKYPDIQRKCHEAIDVVIDTNRMPTLDDRPKLAYLDAVMHEVLRHANIAPFALFHTNLDTPAKINDFDVPPSTIIMYNVASIHHDPTYWKEPNVFNPDRWISENGTELVNHSSHFMPFGLGPRVCPGEALARVEYFIFLAAILHRFQFELRTSNVDDLNGGHEGVVTACPSYEIIAVSR